MKKPISAELQKQLKDYLVENYSKGGNYKDGNVGIAKAILELEHCLDNLKAEFKSTVKHDVTLYSEHIIGSFDHIHPEQFHRQVDYQYAYLFWLFENYEEQASLADNIDKFFSTAKDFLFYPDIQITKTGTTRCKTNLRMCVFELREWGILLRTDERNKRSFGLSPFGMLLMFHLKFEEKKSSLSSLLYPGSSTDRSIDDRIVRAYHHLKSKEGFDSLLKRIDDLNLSSDEKKALAVYKDKFLDVFFEYLNLRRGGVKQTKKDKEVIAEFVVKSERSKEFKLLKEKLQTYFRSKG